MMRTLRALLIMGAVCMAATALTLPSDAVNLVERGKPVASIVIPAQPLPIELYAAQELQYHLESSTGASLFLRPNLTLVGHNLPVFYARTLGEDLKFVMHHAMKGADFDSLTGQFATQGPTLYMLAAMLNHPDASVEGVIDEYCAAFGPARDAVKEYFNYWDSVSGGDDMPEAGTRFLREVGAKIYTPEVMRHAWAIMEKARQAAAGNKMASARVDWLAKGLQHADLTLIAQRAYEASRESGNKTELNRAWQALKDFRRQNEDLDLANFSGLTAMEAETWGGKRGG